MTDLPATESTGEVWGSTWIPSPAPVEGCGTAAGYSVAWVRLVDGPMIQVLVDADAAPLPGVMGRVRAAHVAEETIDVFEPDAAVRR